MILPPTILNKISTYMNLFEWIMVKIKKKKFYSNWLTSVFKNLKLILWNNLEK